MSRFKIAHLLTPVSFGGAERVVLNFLRGVDLSRFDVRLIVLIRPWEEKTHFEREAEALGYPVQRIPVALYPGHEGTDYFRVLRCFRMLCTCLRRNGLQLLHTHGYFADIIGVPACRLMGICHVSTCHGYIYNDWRLGIYNALDLAALHFGGRIIAVSEGIRQQLVKGGISQQRVSVLRNAVALQAPNGGSRDSGVALRKAFHLKNSEKLIGYVGRLDREKGILSLIEAAKKLKERGARFRLLVVGDGPSYEAALEMARDLSLKETVTFVGFQENPENYFAAMDVFVLPSLTEGTPMALLEAMAMGVAVVATAVGGVPQVISTDTNGILVPPADSGALADALFRLLTDEGLRKGLLENAKVTIRDHFSLDQWARQIESLYWNQVQKCGEGCRALHP